MHDRYDPVEYKGLAIAVLVYLVIGAGFYGPSRSGGLGKAVYFLCFPFHAICIPAFTAFGRGMGGLLQSKGFAVFLGVVAFLACLALGGDACTAAFGGFIVFAVAKVGMVVLKEALDE